MLEKGLSPPVRDRAPSGYAGSIAGGASIELRKSAAVNAVEGFEDGEAPDCEGRLWRRLLGRWGLRSEGG